MALENCKVCGSLTTTEEEICIICGHPRKGRKIPKWAIWVAYFLVLVLGIPLIANFFFNINWEEFKRRKKRIDNPEVTVFIS